MFAQIENKDGFLAGYREIAGTDQSFFDADLMQPKKELLLAQF